MRKILLACAAFTIPSLALAQTAPAWKSYQDTGNPADMVKSTAVAAQLGTKVDVSGGSSTGQTLTTPTITGGTSTGLDLKTATLETPVITDPAISGGNISGVGNFSMVGDSSLSVNPVGLGTRIVHSSVFSDTTATDGTVSVWPNVFQMTSSTGYGVVDPSWGGEADRITMFLGAKCLAGSSSCWAENQVFNAGNGFQGHGHGVEIDMENESDDRDPADSTVNQITGLEVTGITKNPISYGIDIVGAGTDVSTNSAYLTHDAIGILGGAAKDNSFVDVSSSAESLHVMGTHEMGLDLTYATISGSAIALDSSHSVNFHNKTASTLFSGLSSDGSSVIVGATSPTNDIGYGGGNGSAFLSVSDNVATVETLAAVGTQSDINLSLAAKGTGSIVAVSPVAVTAISASTSLQVPVVTTAPSGSCTAGVVEVSGTGFHVCVAGAWKTATLN